MSSKSSLINSYYFRLMNYSSKLIIKESAKDFNDSVKQYLENLPNDVKVISCDHSVSFKTVAAKNDALFSCLIVLGHTII